MARFRGLRNTSQAHARSPPLAACADRNEVQLS